MGHTLRDAKGTYWLGRPGERPPESFRVSAADRAEAASLMLQEIYRQHFGVHPGEEVEQGGFLVPPDVVAHMMTGEPYPPETWRDRLAYFGWRVRGYFGGIWGAVRDW